MTSTERLRGEFAEFLKNRNYRNAIVLDACITIGQDHLLKYERIDKYHVQFLTQKDLKNIIKFGENRGIAIWLGGDKLCVGFNSRQNMRLSAYDSVPQRSAHGEILGDGNISVAPEISAAESEVGL